MVKVRFPHNLCISGVSLGMMASIWIWPWHYQILTVILGHSTFGSSIYPPQVCVSCRIQKDDLRSKRNLWVSLLFKSERKGEGEIGGLLLMEKGTLVSMENSGKSSFRSAS